MGVHGPRPGCTYARGWSILDMDDYEAQAEDSIGERVVFIADDFSEIYYGVIYGWVEKPLHPEKNPMELHWPNGGLYVIWDNLEAGFATPSHVQFVRDHPNLNLSTSNRQRRMPKEDTRDWAVLMAKADKATRDAKRGAGRASTAGKRSRLKIPKVSAGRRWSW
jgi:hypothetical protein